jgi:cellobiose-specific phosphotransferase system component IIC
VSPLGNARVLVVVYGVLALAAVGRSGYQLATRFSEAPFAYGLSALAALVYVVATIALARGNRLIALWAMTFELVGVLTVGTLSTANSELFPRDTVWSHFGAGYLWVPLALPIIGMWWLVKGRRP